MTMCADDAHGGRRSKRDAHRRRRARAWRQGLRIRASEPFPHGPAGAARGRANQRPAPCCFCQRSMNAISSRCAAMIRRASCLSAGSLPLLNSTCAMSIAP